MCTPVVGRRPGRATRRIGGRPPASSRRPAVETPLRLHGVLVKMHCGTRWTAWWACEASDHAVNRNWLVAMRRHGYSKWRHRVGGPRFRVVPPAAWCGRRSACWADSSVVRRLRGVSVGTWSGRVVPPRAITQGRSRCRTTAVTRPARRGHASGASRDVECRHRPPATGHRASGTRQGPAPWQPLPRCRALEDECRSRLRPELRPSPEPVRAPRWSPPPHVRRRRHGSRPG